MQQTGKRRLVAYHHDLAVVIAIAADASDECTQAGRVHKRDLGQIDEQARLFGKAGQCLTKLTDAISIDIPTRTKNRVALVLFGFDFKIRHVVLHPVDPDRTGITTGQVAIDGRRYQPMELLIIPNPSFSSHVDFDRVCQQHLQRRDGFVRDRKIRQVYHRRISPFGGRSTNLQVVTHVLLATDADWLFDEVSAALAEPGTTVSRITEGRDVGQAVIQLEPDLVLLDLQIGTKGGVASCIDLRHDIAEGRSKQTKVLMLLDRDADRWIARQADADGWLIKPLDAFRLRRAALATIAGESVFEGEPVVATEEVPTEGDETDASAG